MELLISLAFVLISAAFAWYLIGQDHGQKEPKLALLLAFVMGILGIIVAGILEFIFIPGSSNMNLGASNLTLLSITMPSGALEECGKFLPLALIIYKRRYFNEHTDGIIYFALAGLGAGLLENILYTVVGVAGTGGVQTGLERLIVVPFFHASTTGIVGYYLAKIKLAKRSVFWVAIPLSCAAFLHGLFDFGAFTTSSTLFALSLVIAACLPVGLFFLYRHAIKLDQKLGLNVAPQTTKL